MEETLKRDLFWVRFRDISPAVGPGNEFDVACFSRWTSNIFAMDSLFEKAGELSKAYPKPKVRFSYGTAGFRTRAELLECVMFRMGLLAVLRSKAKAGRVIGVVITASHNPVQDNGVKLVDPLGEMLEESWEKHASSLANADDIVAELKNIIRHTYTDMTNPASIFIARDTRPSGAGLVKALMEGIQALGGIYHDYGMRYFSRGHFYWLRAISKFSHP